MNNPELCHERSPIYLEAREMYRLMKELSRSRAGWMDRDLRRNGRRLLEHAVAAGDAPSVAMMTLSLRYAKLSALKIAAALEAAHIDEQLPADAFLLLRRQLERLLSELGAALPVEAEPNGVSTPLASETLERSPLAVNAARPDDPDDEGPSSSRPMVMLANIPPAGSG
jgi:hypothetical protein